MTIELKPEDARIINQAIQAGLIHCPDEVLDMGIETLRNRLEARPAPRSPARQEAVRRMQEFGDNYRLGLGERITRDLPHEGHRY